MRLLKGKRIIRKGAVFTAIIAPTFATLVLILSTAIPIVTISTQVVTMLQRPNVILGDDAVLIESGPNWQKYHYVGTNNYTIISSTDVVNYLNYTGDYIPINATVTGKTISVSGRSYEYGVDTGIYEAYWRDKHSDTNRVPIALRYKNSSYVVTYEPQDEIMLGSTQIGNRRLSDATVSSNTVSYLGAYGRQGEINTFFANLTFEYLPSMVKENWVVWDKAFIQSKLGSQSESVNLTFPTVIRAYLGNDENSYTDSMGILYGSDRISFKDYGLYIDKEIYTTDEIYFTDDNEDVVCYIPKMYAYDSAGHSILLNKSLELTITNHNIRLEVLVPYTWLNETAVFPIYVDPSTTPIIPLYATEIDNPDGNLSWESETSARDDNNVYATSTGDGNSEYLRVYDFDLGAVIDETYIINGIEVSISRKASANSSVKDSKIYLSDSKGIIDSGNKASLTYWSTVEETVTYGNSTDLWNYSTLTAADISDHDFGVYVATNNSGGIAYIDDVTISVTYTEVEATQPYDYWEAPEHTFGISNFTDVNYTYFRQMFNQNTSWNAEYQRYNYSNWTNANEYFSVDKEWNILAFWKNNLSFIAPVDLYTARFSFSCDMNVTSWSNVSETEVLLNYTVNDTEYYEVYLNWSDIASIPNITFSHGVTDNKFWFVFQDWNLSSGEYLYDPTFGMTTKYVSGYSIEDTAVWEQDTTGSVFTFDGTSGSEVYYMLVALSGSENYIADSKCAIYFDGNGTKLTNGETDVLNIVGDGDSAGTWYNYTFGSTRPTFTNGVSYRFAVLGDGDADGTCAVKYSGTGSWTGVYYDSTAYPTLPSTIAQDGTVDATGMMSAYVYYHEPPTNSPPTIDTFSANPDGTNLWDKDGNNCNFDWSTSDPESNDCSIYITCSAVAGTPGGTPRTATTSDYDFVSTTDDSGGATLTIKAGNEAAWVPTTTDQSFRAWAYDTVSLQFSSSYASSTTEITGIDGVAPTFSSGSCDKDASDKDSDGYLPLETASSAYYDDSTQELLYDFRSCSDATSGIAGYYIYIGSETYGSSDVDGLNVSCQDTSHSDASKNVYYKIVDNAGNEATGDTTDDVIYDDTNPTGTITIAENPASNYLYASGTTGYYSGIGTSVFRIACGDASWSTSGQRTGGGYLFPTTLGHTPSLTTDAFYDYTVTAADSDTGAKTAKLVTSAGNVLTTNSITLTKDTTAPTTTFSSIVEDSPNSYIYYPGTGQTVYFGDGMSTLDNLFTVNVTASDSESGVYSVRMSEWDDDADQNDTSFPYSRQYSTDSTETSGSINLYAYDNVGNYDVSPVVITMTEDTAVPDTSITAIDDGADGPDTITGGATDGVMVTDVSVQIVNTTADPDTYWNGDANNWSTSTWWFYATAQDGTFDEMSDDWTCDTSAVTWGTFSYTAIAKSYDEVNNIDSSPDTEDFIISVGNSAPVLTLPNPSDGATNVGISLSGNYSHFNITINDSEGNGMNITWRTNESGSWLDMGTNSSGSGLPNGTYYCTNVSWVDLCNTEYWWSVNVTDGNGNWKNETYSFTTENPVPDQPTEFSATTYNSTQINLTWTKGTDADNTIIEYSLENSTDGNWLNFTSADGWNTPDNIYDVNTATVAWTQSNTDYLYANVSATEMKKIRIYSWGETIDPHADVDLNIYAYYDSAWNLLWGGFLAHDTWVTINFTSEEIVSSIRIDTDSYGLGIDFVKVAEIQYANQSWDEIVIYNNTGTSYEHTGLDPETTYYYRAWSYNDCSHLNSTTYAFDENTTEIALSPPTGFEATTISRFQINLNWTNTTSDMGSDRVYIEYNISSAPSPWNIGSGTKIDADGYIASNVFSHTSLTDGTHYYYKIWSHNDTQGVNSTTGETNDNTTHSNNAPSVDADGEVPVNNSIDQSTSSTLSVDTTDGNGDNVTVTFYNYSDNSVIGVDVVVDGNGTASTIWSGLAFDVMYQWYVTVDDSYDNITEPNVGGWWNFTVMSSPPLSVDTPFPHNNSQDILTGVGNMSAIVNCSDSWTMKLYDNATHSLRASYVGGSANGVLYFDVNVALYFLFTRDFTWYVNATDGSSWVNRTYYFSTFNGSGFLSIYNTSVNTSVNMSVGIAYDAVNNYVYALDNDDGENLSIFVYKVVNDTFEEAYNFEFPNVISGPPPGLRETWKALAIDIGNYISVLVKRTYYNGMNVELYVFSFDGESLTELRHTAIFSGVGSVSDLCVVRSGDEDRAFFLSHFFGSDKLECYKINDTSTVSESMYPIPGTGYYNGYKLSVMNEYILCVNWTSDSFDLDLFDYSTVEYNFTLHDTYAGTYNEVTNDGHYFFAVSDTAMDIFSVNGTSMELELIYSYVDSGACAASSEDKRFIGSENGNLLSYITEAGEFFERQSMLMTNNSGVVWDIVGDGSYLIIAGEEGGIHLYGYEILRVSPPVIGLLYAGNPGKDAVTRDGTIRYVNQSYNNETYCNVTAYVEVPAYRTIGRYFRTVDDNVLIPSGNLSDGDTNYVNERNQSLIASKYRCTFTGNYSQISGYLIGSGMSPPWTAYAIYNDSSGEPGALLGFTDRDFPGSDVFTDEQRDLGTLYYPPCTRIWQTQDIAFNGTGHPVNSITLTEGSDYWIVFATNDSYGYKKYDLTYSNDIYWLLGNNLGDTCLVKTAPYNIDDDMNFSNVTGLSWSNAIGQNGEEVHYACIYAIANDTYNVNMNTVNITSATLNWYEDGSQTDDYSMTKIGSTNNWTKNLTGLSPGTWYSFDISAVDELGNQIIYEHFRSIVEGHTERIEFQCGVPVYDEATHQGYNDTSTLYRNDSVLYLWNRTYGTDTWYGDDEHMEDALPHEQGVDGTADDTGAWASGLPDDMIQARNCLKFAGAWWDDNISVEGTIQLNNMYVHVWSGGGTKYDTMRLHWGQLNTMYNFGWLSLTEPIGENWNYFELLTNASTRTSAVVNDAPEVCSDPSGVDDTFRLITQHINISSTIGDSTFDGGSIYNFFLGLDNNGTLAWTKESAMIINNRSYLSFVIFNIPQNIFNGSNNETDSDGDTLSDYWEMNHTFTHPFLPDTDGDGYNDSVDVDPNNFLQLCSIILTNWSCYPSSGIASYDDFCFNVTYENLIGRNPSYGFLSVNITRTGWSTNQSMVWVSGENISGANYTYCTMLSSGVYTYTIYAYDGAYHNVSGPHNNPTVDSQSHSFILNTSSSDDNLYYKEWILSLTGVGRTTEYNVSEDNDTAELPSMNITNTGNVPLNFSMFWLSNPGAGISIKYNTTFNPPVHGVHNITTSEQQVISNLNVGSYYHLWLWMDFINVNAGTGTQNIRVNSTIGG